MLPILSPLLLLSVIRSPAVFAVETVGSEHVSKSSNSSVPGYSNITGEDLAVLPMTERTVAGVLRLCQERWPDRFCAWLQVDPETEFVSGGACFNEIEQKCVRIGYTGTKNRRAYRYATCNSCGACSSQGSICDSPNSNCTLLCYCSCGRQFSGSNSSDNSSSSLTQYSDRSKYSIGSNWQFAYPCTGFCDLKSNCPNAEDELSYATCSKMYSTNSVFSWTGFASMFDRVEVRIITAVVIIAIGITLFGILNRKYHWVPWLLNPPPLPRSAAAAALLSDQQQQQQQQ